MGLMDKVKAQATQLAQKTQETARDSKAKFDQSQANRRADGLLRNLGAAVYADRTGRGGEAAQAQIDKLIADISAHEAANGISLAESTDQPQAGGPGPASPSFPEAGPTSSLYFPDAGASSTFPDAGGATSFPESGGATGFPESGAATSFPESGGPAAFPESGAATSFPESDGPAAFPEADTATSFPESGGTVPPPESDSTGG